MDFWTILIILFLVVVLIASDLTFDLIFPKDKDKDDIPRDYRP